MDTTSPICSRSAPNQDQNTDIIKIHRLPIANEERASLRIDPNTKEKRTENRSFASIIKSENKDPGLFVAK